jgi:hypothetical protein
LNDRIVREASALRTFVVSGVPETLLFTESPPQNTEESDEKAYNVEKAKILSEEPKQQ